MCGAPIRLTRLRYCRGRAGLLAADNPDDAVLARNARPVMRAVAQRLPAAPSLPYSSRSQTRSPANVDLVRRSILALALGMGLNMLL